MSAFEPASTTDNQHSDSVQLAVDNDTNNNNSPWHKVEPYIPKGFLINRHGIFTNKDDGEFISGPCWIAAISHPANTKQKSGWGYVVHWIDQDGREQSQAFPAEKLTARGQPLADNLHAMGLKVVPGKQRQLMTYLGSFQIPRSFRNKSVTKLGWLDSDQANPIYVLPNRTIGMEQQAEIVFQPEEHSPTIHTMRSHGSLDQWKALVARRCQGNPVLIFSLCTAFSGPLLKFANMDCGGFHLYGGSSTGKTTALQTAASVWGCGADPSVSEDSYIGRWNTTGNALEATASAHNDGLLALDEMGTCDSRDFGKVIYDLFGGKGKSRLSKNSTLQAQRTWRIMGLSTGEISVAQKIEEDTGKAAKAGHLNRMVDIPINEGVIVDSHGKAAGEFANDLKMAASQFFGTAGPQFIDQLTTHKNDVQNLHHNIQNEIDVWHRDLIENKELDNVQQRVLRRLSVVLVAGKLATEFKILPFKLIDIINSVLAIRDAWLGDDTNKPSTLRGLISLRDFMLSQQSARFRDVNDAMNSGTVIRDLAGYVDHGRKLFLFTDAGLREACKGYDHRNILNELKKRRFLFINDKRMKSRHTIAGAGRPWLYGVRTSLLEAEL